MKRKEQEARIEQQRQEKEKAREDAARERARFVLPNHFSMSGKLTFCPPLRGRFKIERFLFFSHQSIAQDKTFIQCQLSVTL